MKRKSIIAVLALVLVLALSLSIFSACNKKHKYSSEWKFDEKAHWHECTTKKHTDTTEKLPHEFKEEIVKAADYGVVGEKKFTCKDCGYSYTEDIDALGAKDNEIKLAEGKTLDKTYDGSAVDVSDKFSFSGNGEVTLMFKAQGAADDAYDATAPKDAGEYTVKVSVRATAEWKSATKTFDFAIAKKELTATGTKEYDGNATMPATLTGVIAGDAVTATITMDSKNVGATVQSVVLDGADKDNYTINIANVSVTVTQREIKIKDLEVEYNGMSKYILVNIQASSEDATKYNFVTGDHVNLSLTFNGKANAGDTQADLKSISLNSNDAENYKKPEISDVTVTVLQRSITVMNREFKKTKVGVGQFEGSTWFALTEEEGFVAGETELKIGIKDTAVASYAVGGPYNMEFVEDRFVLSGDGKGNYKVVGAVGCTLTISGKEVTLNATYVDANDNPISGIEGNFSVTIDDKGISSQTAQGDLAEYLMKGENKNKNVEVTMEVIDGSVTIAAFSRVGVNTQSDLRYVCNYGSFEVSGDQPTFIEFALFNYNTQYIDENGTWIYTDTTTLNVRIKIRFYDIATLDKNTSAIDAIGANYTAVFETTVDSGEYGSVCTLDLEWTSEKITGSEVIVYNALTGSEINFNKVNEKQYTFDAIAGNTKFYVYVEGVGGDNQVSLKVTLTCALNEGTPTRLEFSDGATELSSGELTYAAGEEKRFVFGAGANPRNGMKYTFSNIPEGATIKVYRADGSAVTLSADNSFTIPARVPVSDYTIVITNTTDSELKINFSITKEQTPGGGIVRP